MPVLPQRASRRLFLLLLLPFIFLLSLFLLHKQLFAITHIRSSSSKGGVPPLLNPNEINTTTTPIPDCPPLPGIDRILVILKTGVTEAHVKLPIHGETILRCIPNYIVWSDYSETIAGIPVYDVLTNTPESLQSLPDFDLYARVQTHGREALTTIDLADDASTPFGKPSNPGWKLDKWKFLPMISETLRESQRHYNNGSENQLDWFVFMEADTYLSWPALLAWLSQLDATQPHYVGNPMQIGSTVFAHGGSGFVLSRPALEKAVQLRETEADKWDQVTMSNWAGDCVLGMLMHEAGVPMRWAWPMLQTGRPKEVNYFANQYMKTAWCYPAVSFHHVHSEDVRELWWLDRAQWARREDGETPLRYRDVFYQMMRPRIEMDSQGLRVDWDNLAGEENRVTLAQTPVECRELCEQDPACLQWMFRAENTCYLATEGKLGEAKSGCTSGWMVDRIDARAEMLGGCEATNWLVY